MRIVLFLFVLTFAWLIVENLLILMTSHFTCRINIPKELDGLRFVQLSDLHKRHFGKNNIRIVEKVRREKPNIIFLTGDMVHRSADDFSAFSRFLADLCKIAPVYYGIGNHETDLSERLRAELFKIIKDCGAVVLDNSSVTLERNNSRICIKGVTIKRECYKTENGYAKLQVPDVECLGERPTVPTILLAHNPLFFEVYSEWGASLVLSGHVHGGAVRLPLLKGILSPERRFFPRYSAGLYYKENSVMLVSRGLGKLRAFNPPEIVVGTLHTNM